MHCIEKRNDMPHCPDIKQVFFFSIPSIPFLTLASLLFHLHDEENGEGRNLEVAQEKIEVATMVRKFAAIC